MSAACSPWVFLGLSDAAGKSGAAYGRGPNAQAFGLPVLPPPARQPLLACDQVAVAHREVLEHRIDDEVGTFDVLRLVLDPEGLDAAS